MSKHAIKAREELIGSLIAQLNSVKAVNAELLAALKALDACLISGDEVWEKGSDNLPVYDSIPEFTVRIAKQVTAAIAKAERTTP